jgi:hypothetical protein
MVQPTKEKKIMIYTYALNNEFISDLDNKCTIKEALKINTFVRESFMNKENIYYCGSRDFVKKFGTSQQEITNMFIQDLQAEIGILENEKDELIDFGFGSNEKKIGSTTITCDDIINKKVTKETIKKLTPAFFIGKKSSKGDKKKQKKILIGCFKKIFKFTDQVYFIDRHIPVILLDNKLAEKTNNEDIRSYKNSLEVYSTLLSLSKTKKEIKFFNGIIKSQMDRYLPKLPSEIKELDLKKDENREIKKKYLAKRENEFKEQAEKILKDFYNIMSSKNLKATIFVKNDEKAFNVLHDRYIATYRVIMRGNKLDYELFNLFGVPHGIALWGGDKEYSIKGKNILRIPNDAATEINEKFIENVEKSSNFLFFSINPEKNLST